ncbi:MAG: amphi-Trp domain-containing protein [Desulfosarcina sp.]|nr:amphi-Trp domain-containing protein [Desulfobacterales bacterium]
MAEQKFDYENEEELAMIRSHIDAILEGLENNRLVFKTSKEEIILHPESPLKIKIKAGKKGKECKLTIRLAWKERYKQGDDGMISISSQESENRAST